MNNGLGIKFFRYTKEEDGEHWSQIFAKFPFDEVELKQKGALLGVIKGEFSESWPDKDIEITTWIDEYFNSVETKANLVDFYSQFLTKFASYDCVWLWMYTVEDKRLIKVVGKGEGFFIVNRGEREIDMSSAARSGKVLTGEIKAGDTISFGIGEVDKNSSEWTEESILSEESHGVFKINVEKMTEGFEMEMEEKEDKEDKVVETGDTPIVEKKEVRYYGNEDLAEDKVVGKQSFLKKIAGVFNRGDGLRVSNEESKAKRKKLSLILGSLFMVLLVISIAMGKVRQRGLETEKRWLEFSTPIEKVLVEAVGVSKLNNASAKKMVSDVRATFESQKVAYGETHKEKTDELGKKIEDVWVTVSGEKNSELVEVLNFELIRAGVSVNKISRAREDQFSVIGQEQGLVLSAAVKDKDIKVVAGKGAGLGWIDSVSDGVKSFVLTKGGVFEVGNESNSLVFDTSVTDPISLMKFASNLYVLEKGNKEIFKYTIGEASFGERTRWLKEGVTLSATPVDMAIDVDIWVLEEGNVLERFRRGVKEAFTLSGVPDGMLLERVSVEEEGDRIAFLAKSQSSVLICSKETGVCDKQLKNDKLSGALDIVFGGEGELFVLLPSSLGVLN